MVQPHLGVLGGGRSISARLRIGAGADVDACPGRGLRSDNSCGATRGESQGATSFEFQLTLLPGGRRGAAMGVSACLLRLGASNAAARLQRSNQMEPYTQV